MNTAATLNDGRGECNETLQQRHRYYDIESRAIYSVVFRDVITK